MTDEPMPMPIHFLGNDYLFNAAPLRPVVVVAVAGGQHRDWAAYIAGVDEWGEPGPEIWQAVREFGFKLTEDKARAFFPGIALPYRP